MKNKYLIDTNIIIYYFNGIIADEYIHDILLNSFNISIISKIEFLSWKKLLDNTNLRKKSEDFISNSIIYELDDVVADKVIELRQRYNIKTPDAIIGATAIVHGFELVTNNVIDFKQLDLKLISVNTK